MSLFTSSHFASATATGKDWREAAKAVLEKLDEIKTDHAGFNLGFLYITDHLSDDADSILNLFKSVLGVKNWVGANAVGVCGCGEEYINEPAISAMIGRFDADDFCLFSAASPETDNEMPDAQKLQDSVDQWQKTNDPMLVLAHADPVAEEDPAVGLEALGTSLPGFIVGGLSSSRRHQIQIAHTLCSNGVSGVAFADRVATAAAISQGCVPIGPTHHITRADEHTILEINGENALHVFEQDLRNLAIHTIGKDPDDILVDSDNLHDIPKDFHSLLKGDMHVAFPVSTSDQNDYLVRNIIGLDPDEGSLSVSQLLSHGERILFVHRDDDTVQEDLSKQLIDLRKRVLHEQGGFTPKGALYISCAGRAKAVVEQKAKSEMSLIQNIIGDVPLAGFYAGGEIYNGRIHNYTGILILFL